MIPPAAVRLRRDFGQVLCAIDAHALLHREQRPRDADGQIVADIENDYEAVRGLINSILSEGAGIAVNPAMVETIAAVEKATAALPIGEGASAQDIGKILKLDKSAARAASYKRVTTASSSTSKCAGECRASTEPLNKRLSFLASCRRPRSCARSTKKTRAVIPLRNPCHRATGRRNLLRNIKMTVARTVARRWQATENRWCSSKRMMSWEG